MYRWWNYLNARVQGKIALRISLDETSVKFWPSSKAIGNLYVGFGRTCGAAKASAVSRVSLADARSCMTHVAIVCDDSTIQAKLPQVLICRKSVIRVDQVDAISEALPPNFKVLAAPSAWTNEQIMGYIIRLLANALVEYSGTHQPILFMDTAPSHLHESVITSCYERGIWLGYIPAGTTWLFQVLDTHCFGAFKQRLARAQTDERSRLGGTRLTIVEWVRCFVTAAKSSLQGKAWDTAFDENGFCQWPPRCRKEVLRELEWELFPLIDSNVPTAEDLKVVWPRNKPVPTDTILAALDSLAPPMTPLPPPPTPFICDEAAPSSYAPARRLSRKTSVEELGDGRATFGPNGSQSSVP